MKLWNWLSTRFWQRGDAYSCYKRAMASANKHDQQAALAGYTAVIEMENAPHDLQSMALYNRALVYTAGHQDAEAISDLEQLLEMPGAAANVRLEARRKLVRMKRKSERDDVPPTAHGS